MPTDPRIPSREDAVLRYVLERRAAEEPDKIFAIFDDGPTWTRSDLLREVRRTAAALEELGVRQFDNVVCWLPNGPDMVRFWFALNYLGAVFVPINTAYRGGLLSHVLGNSEAKVIIGDAGLLPRLGQIESRGSLRLAVQVGGVDRLGIDGIDVLTAAELDGVRGTPSEPPVPVEPWHTQAILYTSGTTGPSKGVLTSYVQAWSAFGPETMPIMTADDRFLINMPAFHAGGSTLLYAMLLNGGSVAVVDRFSGERFWRQIRDSRSTMVFLLGVMANFVNRRPPEDDDADNPLAKVFIVPLLDDIAAFSRRFGVDVYTIYNMTELSAPIVSGPNPVEKGTCGKVRRGMEVRLVDEADREVPIGETGEIVVRADTPWALTHGYFRMPEATARAWRNGWFHTGDTARRDAEGNYYFADRLKDSIRRRGENISSMEVETEIMAHPLVQEAAVVAVPSEVSEDEVMAVIAPVPGARVDPVDLLRFLEPRMAYYMVPRYLRFVTELPKTPTAKIQKSVLREAAVTSDTWDRETAGIKITRGNSG
ncbi:AMP-binding protein [Amycolatopsis sp. EV170708-02-1]|uniref:AMP-binding protein n=1 Tax=Amycolatopsis sp. EV170708-02-1 TaxID=2919322 RepID=UPI001F0C1A78|nr:AMP-binding protein [Amycolatopsis sp. EV170708-02-1]UMP00053.1 AMP-binding protein [Amycolatopsis sp. EV170708-02-1]